jgi:uncharacterized small protein (DUF1192 family)
MPLIEDEPKRKPTAPHTVGEELATLSEDELRHRIGLLRDEIVRIEAALRQKEESRKTAASFFRR